MYCNQSCVLDVALFPGMHSNVQFEGVPGIHCSYMRENLVRKCIHEQSKSHEEVTWTMEAVCV